MKIIIPMAGVGKRMRPHTLTTPKPMFPIAGRPIVQRLVDEIVKVYNKPVEEISFIIRDFGKGIENQLINLAIKNNSKGKIYYQKEPLGTAHAIYCAEPSLNDEIVIAFADTIFYSNLSFIEDCDATVWVKEVEDPSSFGVVNVNNNNIITGFIEKPSKPISNLAIIGIYYFKKGEILKDEIKYLLNNKIKENNEYQITNALESLKNKNFVIKPAKVDKWLDCGNKDSTISTTSTVLSLIPENKLVSNKAVISNSTIIKPCFIDDNVEITNSIIGPNVSIEANTEIYNCNISESIIMSYSNIKNAIFSKSIIGNNVTIDKEMKEYNIGDFNSI